MKNTKAGRKKKEANYEEAMKEAFGEIFQNLKEIEKDTKIQRQRMDLQRRRGSARATTLRETTAAFSMKPKNELTRTSSTPVPPRTNSPKELTRKLPTQLPPKTSLSTMQWVLACFEEEENM